VLLLEQMERQALADRQAEMSVAITERWEDYSPVNVAERLEAFDEWLNADPSDSEEARAQRHIAELTGAA
jgi:predicted component of type VI protein secretion system